jgi:predicted esterase
MPPSPRHRPGRVLAVAALLAGLALPPAGCAPEGSSLPAGATLGFEVPYGEPPVPGETTPCLFSVPEDYEPTCRWPLVVALHGFGDDAANFHVFWKGAVLRAGCVLLVPQGELLADGGPGWAWGAAADRVVRRALEAVQRRVNVDPDRITLLGFSQGGSVTYLTAFAHPYLFRGVAPLGAYFDAAWLPAGDAAGTLAGLPVYIGHGALDRHLDEARVAADTLAALGCRVRLEVYPELGHRLPLPIDEELRRILGFLAGG